VIASILCEAAKPENSIFNKNKTHKVNDRVIYLGFIFTLVSILRMVCR
jgi:hypothetical protein